MDASALDEVDLAVGRAWLDGAERARSATYGRADLRRTYDAAHAMARWAVGAALGAHPAEVRWGRHDCPGCGAAHGRPRPEGVSLEFSLSRTSTWAVVAVAHVPVGIDVEQHPVDALALAHCLHPLEHAEIRADPAEAGLRFSRVWTRTEAYLKGLGIGLARHPGSDYLGSDAAPHRRLGEWLICDVVAPPGSSAAVALVSDREVSDREPPGVGAVVDGRAGPASA